MDSYHIVTAANGNWTAFPAAQFDDALDYFNDHAGPEARIDFHVSADQFNRFYAPSTNGEVAQ